MTVKLPAHRVTTVQLAGAYPFVADAGLGSRGVYLGREAWGGAFCYDPWTHYEDGVLTNPNMLIAGQVGRGKSALVKTYLWRQLAFGRTAWILDPKGEYGALAAAAGATPLRLGPGSPLRVNPLDAPPGITDHEQVLRRRVSLLAALLAASLRRTLQPEETTAVELAVRTATTLTPGVAPTLPDVVTALLHPTQAAAADIATTADALAAAGRQVALELRRLCAGDLGGIFDDHTSAHLNLSAPVVVLDLSAVYGSQALGLLMLCAAAWLTAAATADTTRRRLLVVDEAWAVLSDLRTAQWLQASWKLSRQTGIANIAVVHRLSDLTATGDSGSHTTRLTSGLLADSETRVLYAQPPDATTTAADLLGLTATETALLPRLGRGVGLWHVGTRRYLVTHHLGGDEHHIVDTDAAMNPAPPANTTSRRSVHDR